MVKSWFCTPSAGSPITVTVDGGESQTVLPNLTPGVTYQVSVISVKGLEESEPAFDTFTTGTIYTHSSMMNVKEILHHFSAICVAYV